VAAIIDVFDYVTTNDILFDAPAGKHFAGSRQNDHRRSGTRQYYEKRFNKKGQARITKKPEQIPNGHYYFMLPLELVWRYYYFGR
jgi:hypothetical protein